MKARLESLLSPADRLVDAKRFELPSFDHPYHFHPELEITFIEESTGTRVIGDHIGSFQPGELYLMGANLPHVFRNTVAPQKGAAAEVMHLSRQRLEACFPGVEEMREFFQLMDQCAPGLVFDPETSELGSHLLRRVRQTSGTKRLAAFFELAATLVHAPGPRVLASVGYVMTSSSPAGAGRIQAACDIILKEFMDELDHGNISRRLHMAPATFSRLFRRTTGKTFTEFVNEVRLGHACRLLSESKRTVTEIAYASGFGNLSNFNRRFREHHHCNPREYRYACKGAADPGSSDRK